MKNLPLTIKEHTVSPGEKITLMLPLPELYDGSPMYMPVHVVCGKQSGPTLVVLAAIHGDEINGVEIINRLMKRKVLNSIKGNLIAVPIANIYGYIYKSRYLMDRRDLNRSFPGSIKGSIAARLANFLLKEILVSASIVIDLHTASLHRSNVPQIRATLADKKITALAKSFGAPVVLETAVLKGSLRESINEMKIPYLLYEAGEALRLDELSINVGVRGLLNVMRHSEMLKKTHREGGHDPTIAYSSKWIRANTGGLMTPVKRLGKKVEKDELIAIIVDPMTLTETNVYSPISGIVIGMTRLPLVHEGEALFHIASVKRPNQISEQIADLEEFYDH